MCASLQRWRDRGERELPWLAGPGFSALGRISPSPPAQGDLQVLARFLAGVETEAPRVTAAITRCGARTGASELAVPPDARGALVDAVAGFFELLGKAYGALHEAVRGGHRGFVDDLVAQWQPRLDVAAGQIDHRAAMLLDGPEGEVGATAPRRVSDHPGLALVFLVLALLAAGGVLWLVQQGWPMAPVELPF